MFKQSYNTARFDRNCCAFYIKKNYFSNIFESTVVGCCSAMSLLDELLVYVGYFLCMLHCLFHCVLCLYETTTVDIGTFDATVVETILNFSDEDILIDNLFRNSALFLHQKPRRDRDRSRAVKTVSCSIVPNARSLNPESMCNGAKWQSLHKKPHMKRYMLLKKKTKQKRSHATLQLLHILLQIVQHWMCLRKGRKEHIHLLIIHVICL